MKRNRIFGGRRGRTIGMKTNQGRLDAKNESRNSVSQAGALILGMIRKQK